MSEYTMDRALDWNVGNVKDAEEKLQELRASFFDGAEQDFGYQLRWYGADVIEAEARLKIAAEFERMMTPNAEQPEWEPLSAEEAVDAWMRSEESSMQSARAESKSTGQLTNIVEDIHAAVRVKTYGKLAEFRRIFAHKREEEKAMTSDEDLAARLPEYGAEAVGNLFPEDLNRLAANVRAAEKAAREKAQAES